MKLTFEGGPRAGQSITLDPGRSVSIGRDPSADVFLDDARVSRPHARIWVDASGGARIEDLRSSNGTFVNGQRIDGATPLNDGDTITLGNTRMTVASESKSGAATIVGDVTTAGDTQVVVPPSRTASPSMVMMRESVGRANRNSRIAAVIAGGVVLVAVIGIAWYFIAGRTPTSDEVAVQMKPSTVYVAVQNDYSSGNGTGWVYDADKGLIVTNNHVIDGIRQVSVTGEGLTPRTANIVAAAPCDDVAMIHVDDKAGLKSVKLGSQGSLDQGEKVIALGYPVTGSAERKLALTDGVVSVAKTTFEGSSEIPNMPNMIQSSARINPGNSGGPLLNAAGELVGMNTILIESLDQNYAVGVDRIKEIAPGLATGSGLAWTGMGFIVPDAETLAALGLPVTDGLLVVSVTPGSEADQQGFGKFPVLLTAIDGHPVKDLPSYCAVAGNKKSGDLSTFTITFVDPATQQAVTGDAPMHFR